MDDSIYRPLTSRLFGETPMINKAHVDPPKTNVTNQQNDQRPKTSSSDLLDPLSAKDSHKAIPATTPNASGGSKMGGPVATPVVKMEESVHKPLKSGQLVKRQRVDESHADAPKTNGTKERSHWPISVLLNPLGAQDTLTSKPPDSNLKNKPIVPPENRTTVFEPARPFWRPERRQTAETETRETRSYYR
jgi:hypothetical protein